MNSRRYPRCSITFITSEKPLPVIKSPWWTEGIGCRKGAGEHEAGPPQRHWGAWVSCESKSCILHGQSPRSVPCSWTHLQRAQGGAADSGSSCGAAPHTRHHRGTSAEQWFSIYWTKCELQCQAWVGKKENDLLVAFSRSFRGIFLYTMDTTEHKLIYGGTWNQVKNNSSATEDMLTFIIPAVEDQNTIL